LLQRAGLALAVLLCLLGARNAANAIRQLSSDASFIEVQVQRLRVLEPALPEHAVAGFLTDLPKGSDQETWALYTTQYALAPRLVIPYPSSRRCDWVIGNFTQPVDLERIARENKLRLIRDYDGGVVLFRPW